MRAEQAASERIDSKYKSAGRRAPAYKKAPLMIKPSKPPQRAREKPQNRASPVGNAPLLPPVAASSPEGQILAVLCYELIMGANVEWRANLPLRGRCRRQKGCISIRRSLVGMFSLRAKGAVVWFYQKRRPLYSKGHPPQARRAHLTSGLRSDRLTACAVPPFLVLRTTFPPASGGTTKRPVTSSGAKRSREISQHHAARHK